MKDAYQIFDEKLPVISKAIDERNFLTSAKLCHDLILTFSLIGFEDGILINEILENTFVNIDQILRAQKVEKELVDSIGIEIKNNLTKISDTYRKEDKNELYNALKTIRVTVTIFQFEMWRQPENDLIPAVPLMPNIRIQE